MVVIGGGVVGLMSAHALALDGHEVTVLDRGTPDGERCSSGNAGFVVPSHFVPLAAPGMIGEGLRMMFQPKGPFRIKPRLDADLLRWLTLFARSATASHAERSGPLLRDLNLESIAIYRDLAKVGDFGFQETGLLAVCLTEETLRHEAKTAEQARELGLRAEVVDGAGARRLEPGLPYAAAGAVYFPEDCSLDPGRLLAFLVGALPAMGVKLVYDCEIDRLIGDGGRVSRVETSGGAIEGDTFVLAAGSWSARLAGGLKLSLPLQAGKGYSMTLEHGEPKATMPALIIDKRLAISPLGDGMRVGGTMEIGGLDLGVDRRRVDGIVDAFVSAVPGFERSRFDGVPVWKGLRPCSPDGLPYVGSFAKYPNLLAATGHAMLGVSLAAVTGKRVAKVVSGEALPDRECALLSPDRF